MAESTKKNLVKTLSSRPHGAPIDTDDLAAIGVSPALASHYVKAGWLERLGRGVFAFPSDALLQESCLKFLEERIPGFHVGAKTALEWRGISHNLSLTGKLSLWGDVPAALPDWFTSRFPADYVARHLFDRELPATYGLQPLPESPDGPLVSVPERALLEMLSDVGLRQTVEEARNLLEGLPRLRPEVIETLLQHCTRVKVTRLCVQWSEELEMPWATLARRAAKSFGSNARWSTRMRDGTTLSLKR